MVIIKRKTNWKKYRLIGKEWKLFRQILKLKNMENNISIFPFVITIILMHLSLFIFAQESIKVDLAMQNNLKIIEEYVTETLDGQDSFLLTKEYFNKKGRTTLKEIYNRDGLTCSYSYFYKDDTVRTKRITVCRDKLLSKTKIWYDRKNREVKAIDYDGNGRKTGTFSKIKYNDKLKTKEVYIRFDNGKIIEIKTQFADNMDAASNYEKKNGVWVEMATRNDTLVLRTEDENFNGSKLNRISTTSRITESKTIISVKGAQKFEKGDIVKTETYIMQNGLKAYQTQYLNEEFNARKRFVYYTH